jgi:hypothetical protein
MAVVIVQGEKITETFTKFNVEDAEEIGAALWVDVTADLLSGEVSHAITVEKNTYSGTLWSTHVKLLNDLIQQVVKRGLARCKSNGVYVRA